MEIRRDGRHFSSATGEQGRGMGRRHPGCRVSIRSGRGRRGAETMVGQMHEGMVRVGEDHLAVGFLTFAPPSSITSHGGVPFSTGSVCAE